MAKEKSPKERANERYLHDIFMMVRRRDAFIVAQKNSQFSDTELRMLSEILAAKHKGERLISTKIADRLGITRSAVSQIVGKLEQDGAVRRVPDAVDRKIAYVELTDEIMEKYKDVVDDYVNFIGMIVARMGVNKMDKFLSLATDFYAAVEEAMKDKKASK